MEDTQHIVLDFEMNPVPRRKRRHGSHADLQSEIIEIGAVKLAGSGEYEKKDEFSLLVKPELNDRIESKITELTGLTTDDVKDAVGYAEAIRRFSEWIGEDEPARIYSWSTSDSSQIHCECRAKNIELPENMLDWVDFQKMFPRVTGLQTKRQLSLEYAAELAGVDFDEDSAHRALYDARVTAEMVRMVLTGTYEEKMKKVTGVLRNQVETDTATLADKLGSKYAELVEKFGSGSGDAGVKER